MGRTPGLIRGGTIHLMPMEEMGLGEGNHENNSKILVGGRGEGGVPHLHTAGSPKFSSASLRAKHTKASAQRSASPLLASPHRGALPQTREQTPQGLVKGPGESALGTPACRRQCWAPGCDPRHRAPAGLSSRQPAYKPIARGQVCALLLLWDVFPTALLTVSFTGLTGRCRETDPRAGP